MLFGNEVAKAINVTAPFLIFFLLNFFSFFSNLRIFLHDVVSLFYSTALQDSIVNKKMLTKDELLTIHGNWVNIDDDKEVVNVTIDEEIAN